MSKSYLSILIIIFLIVAGVIFYSLSKPKIGPDEAVLIINNGEKKRAFAGEVIEGMTIFDALTASAKAGNFNFVEESGILKRIDGFERNGKKWNAYINNSRVEEILNKTLIKPGNKIELKFE